MTSLKDYSFGLFQFVGANRSYKVEPRVTLVLLCTINFPPKFLLQKCPVCWRHWMRRV